MVGHEEMEPHPNVSYAMYSDIIGNAARKYGMEMLFTDFLCYRGPSMQQYVAITRGRAKAAVPHQRTSPPKHSMPRVGRGSDHARNNVGPHGAARAYSEAIETSPAAAHNDAQATPTGRGVHVGVAAVR